MTKISPVEVVRHQNLSFPGIEISGFVMIAESHLSIHAFPEQGIFKADVFSCRNFDLVFATNRLKEFFGAQEVETEFIPRSGREPSLTR